LIVVERYPDNPILKPDSANSWEAWATFNGCPVEEDGRIALLYRAMSTPHYHTSIDSWMRMSVVGCAISGDGYSFRHRRELVIPEEPWEQFGCEDPRVTRLDDTYYIFYTALSKFPFTAEGIRVGVALSKDLGKISAKHLVTPFNAKAMTLFPERINGRLWAVLTAHTDMPPAYVALASFDRPEEMWSEAYWQRWHSSLAEHALPLQRNPQDHVEVGAPPVKTPYGWLLVYSYIQNYYSADRLFTIEAALLDGDDPGRIVAHTRTPLLMPEEQYEMQGTVPDVVFPSGALVRGESLHIYYGAADTTCCLATTDLSRLLSYMVAPGGECRVLTRGPSNPIITPKPENEWEAKATFNPGAVQIDGTVHIVYRAMSPDNTSTLGYATSRSGLAVDWRSSEPIYVPRESFEMKRTPGGNSGCEDPRLTLIEDTLYMCYTAYDGVNPTRVALTSIPVESFLKKDWRWARPVLISPPGYDDKDACIFPGKVDGQYLIFHRIGDDIDIALVPDLKFSGGRWLGERRWLKPRRGWWDSYKVGIAAPPVRTKRGWLLLYHGVAGDRKYRVGAVLMDLNNPAVIIGRTDEPLLQAETECERKGQVPDVVFPCGCVVIGQRLFVYYGGGDSVCCVATIDVDDVRTLEC